MLRNTFEDDSLVYFLIQKLFAGEILNLLLFYELYIRHIEFFNFNSKHRRQIQILLKSC